MNLHAIEKTSPAFQVAHLLEAQKKSWASLNDLSRRIEPGMTELQAAELATQILTAHGSSRFWHRSLVRFGDDTCKFFGAPANPTRVLQSSDVFFIDLGPTWLIDGVEYEGDVGDTFSVGNFDGAKICAENAREIFKTGRQAWLENKLTGPELYQLLIAETKKRGFEMVVEADGHRIGDFPHKKIASQGLTEIDFVPSPALWVLEVQIRDPQSRFGAFFEDILV